MSGKTKTLYKLNNNNRISWWRIDLADDSFTVSWGHDVETINNSSKNSETYNVDNAEDQFYSRIQKQIARQGYSTEIPTAQPDLPMLAQTWKDHKSKVKTGAREPFKISAIQPKLDGIRCLATNNGLKTRKNVILSSVPHIEAIISKLDPKWKLDGELIVPNCSLQDIQSLVLRNCPHSAYKALQYHVFDIVTEGPFHERYAQLVQLQQEILTIHEEAYSLQQKIPTQLRSDEVHPQICPITVVPTIIVDHPSHTQEFAVKLRKEWKYWTDRNMEGVIVRDALGPYQINKRSPYLLKYKEFLDNEFEIIDVSIGHYKTGVFVCKTPEGITFEATPKATKTVKKMIAHYKEKWIGGEVTVAYEKLSDIGKPLKPVATSWRKPQ